VSGKRTATLNRYRDMAKTLAFEGHIAWAEGDAITAVEPQ
jgi:hypothetical protein